LIAAHPGSNLAKRTRLKKRNKINALESFGQTESNARRALPNWRHFGETKPTGPCGLPAYGAVKRLDATRAAVSVAQRLYWRTSIRLRPLLRPPSRAIFTIDDLAVMNIEERACT
jgi:hypothetical protein